MTNTTHTQPAARALTEGDVITQAGTEYYVTRDYRGTVELIRLHDLKPGFGTNAATFRAESRRATEEERERVMALLLERLEAEAKYRPGALVRAVKASKHVDPNALYVITKTSAKTVSIVELGGNASGAYINAGRAALAVVEPADVLK